MQSIDALDLMTCIQAVEGMLEHNDEEVRAMRASPADLVEENLMWETTLNRLGAMYEDERAENPVLIPISRFSAYFRSHHPKD